MEFPPFPARAGEPSLYPRTVEPGAVTIELTSRSVKLQLAATHVAVPSAGAEAGHWSMEYQSGPDPSTSSGRPPIYRTRCTGGGGHGGPRRHAARCIFSGRIEMVLAGRRHFSGLKGHRALDPFLPGALAFSLPSENNNVRSKLLGLGTNSLRQMPCSQEGLSSTSTRGGVSVMVPPIPIGKSRAMHAGRIVFSHLLDFFPIYEFYRRGRRYRGRACLP